MGSWNSMPRWQTAAAGVDLLWSDPTARRRVSGCGDGGRPRPEACPSRHPSTRHGRARPDACAAAAAPLHNGNASLLAAAASSRTTVENRRTTTRTTRPARGEPPRRPLHARTHARARPHWRDAAPGVAARRPRYRRRAPPTRAQRVTGGRARRPLPRLPRSLCHLGRVPHHRAAPPPRPPPPIPPPPCTHVRGVRDRRWRRH